MDIAFLMVKNIFLQKYHISAKNILNFLAVQPKLICGNLTEYQKNITNITTSSITTSDSTFAQTLIKTRPLPVVNFNGNCIKINKV